MALKIIKIQWITPRRNCLQNKFRANRNYHITTINHYVFTETAITNKQMEQKGNSIENEHKAAQQPGTRSATRARSRQSSCDCRCTAPLDRPSKRSRRICWASASSRTYQRTIPSPTGCKRPNKWIIPTDMVIYSQRSLSKYKKSP